MVSIFDLGGVEDPGPAPEFRRQVDHRDDDHQVDQDVLDEGDQRRRPQARLERVQRQHQERDEQRQVPDEAAAVDAHGAQHGFQTDQLQSDVRHGGDDPGDRDQQREQVRGVAAADEVGRGHVAVGAGHRPQPEHREEHDRVEDDRVGQGEEAHRAGAEHQRRDGDEGVGGVEVAAHQEPGDPGAELTAAQSPFVQMVHGVAGLPPGGNEPHRRDPDEQDGEDDELDGVEVPVHAASRRQSRCPCAAG